MNIKFVVIYTVLSYFSCVLVTANNLVYQYGRDTNKPYFYIDQFAGDVRPHELFKKIFLTLPACRSIEYVRIEVQNPYSVPRVAFDRATRRVIIAYLPQQSSASTYTILVKSRPSMNCNDDPFDSEYPDDLNSRISLDYYGY